MIFSEENAEGLYACISSSLLLVVGTFIYNLLICKENVTMLKGKNSTSLHQAIYYFN